MVTVKINNKKYEVKELGFSDMVHMEEMGFSVIESFKKKQFFSLATAFAGIAAHCDREDAEYLCEQHILGGGNIADIVTAFNTAVEESGFSKSFWGGNRKKRPRRTRNNFKRICESGYTII